MCRWLLVASIVWIMLNLGLVSLLLWRCCRLKGEDVRDED